MKISSKVIHVAVGVVINAAGEILITLRDAAKDQGGLWEFPGGKVEAGESVFNALKRELFEEVDLSVEDAEPLIQITYEYPNKSVMLDVFKVGSFSGDARGKEGQHFRWVSPSNLHDYDFPSANYSIINALSLPRFVAFSNDFPSNESLNHFKAQNVGRVIVRGLGSDSTQSKTSSLMDYSILSHMKKLGLSLSLSSRYGKDCFLANRNGSDKSSDSSEKIGCHLTSQDLHRINRLPTRKVACLYSASCHTEADIEKANALRLDFITLSPINQTLTHPSAPQLGWNKFRQLCALSHVPVYALGGLKQDDLAQALHCGAQGIAGIRLFE